MAASAAARSPHAGAPARPSHAHDRFPLRSAVVPSPCGVSQRRSAAARPPAKAAASDVAATNDPRDKSARGVVPRLPQTSAATTYRRSSARHHGVSPPLGRNNQSPRRRPAHDDLQVRDERYGEAPSGSSFDCEPWQTHRLKGGPDDLLSRSQPVEARHLDSAYVGVRERAEQLGDAGLEDRVGSTGRAPDALEALQ